MADIQSLKRGDTVSFSLVRQGIITDSFDSVIVDTVNAGYDLVSLVDTSLNEKHANLYPFFKNKVDNVNNPNAYAYLVVKTSNLSNRPIIVGIPWIEESSLRSTSTNTLVLTLHQFEEGKRPSLETYLKNAKISYSIAENT